MTGATSFAMPAVNRAAGASLVGLTALALLLTAAFAGSTASFVCLVLERRLEGRSPLGRSACVCGRRIPLYRNIPVLSWVLQGGRAACCGAPIPRWYMVAEFGTVVAAWCGAVLLHSLFWGALAGTAAATMVLCAWHARAFAEDGHREPDAR